MNNGRAVKCIETGKTYLSVAEAAKEHYITYTAISAACSGRLKTAAGFHWKFCTPEEERRETVRRVLQSDPAFMNAVEGLKNGR